MNIPRILDEKVIPIRYDVDSMADKEQPRSIRFPQNLWDAIDRDAARCGRSAVKQMEVLLSVYYGFRNVELDVFRLAAMRGELIETPEVLMDRTGRQGNIQKQDAVPPLTRTSKFADGSDKRLEVKKTKKDSKRKTG